MIETKKWMTDVLEMEEIEKAKVSTFEPKQLSDRSPFSSHGIDDYFNRFVNEKAESDLATYSSLSNLIRKFDLQVVKRNVQTEKATNTIKKSATTIFTQLRKVYIDFMTSFDLTNAEKYYKNNYGRQSSGN
jgi:hypothetical protein